MTADWRGAPPLRKAAHALLTFLFRALWGLRVEGLEFLPEDGGVIVAGGPHLAYFDIVLALAAGPKRYLLGLTKAEAFKVPLLGWFLRNAGGVPLDRKAGIGGLRAGIEVLQRGGCLGIFPEGTRSKTGAPGPAKAGVGYLASRSRAPVVPARVFGMRTFPFTRSVRVRFGPAMSLDDPRADGAACRDFAQAVLDRALSL